MVHSLVANGLGYSILNFQTATHSSCDSKPLAYIDIKEHYPELQIVLAWLKQSRLTRRARTFVEAAQVYVSATPYTRLRN